MLNQAMLPLAACVALATLFAAESADARPYAQRCEAYNSQANPDYGFGPCVTVQPNDVVIGAPSWPEGRPRRLHGPSFPRGS
jgi:hypothetical protein